MTQVLSSVLFFGGCALDFGSTESDRSTVAEVGLQNYLPVDGCTWVVRMGDAEYAPDRDSIVKIEEFTKNADGTTKAKVDYTITGNLATVQCDAVTPQTLPEISLTKISKP